MAAHRGLSITCDHGGNYSCTTPEYFAGPRETAREARAYLRSVGWRYRAGKDLCPEHAGAAATAPSR